MIGEQGDLPLLTAIGLADGHHQGPRRSNVHLQLNNEIRAMNDHVIPAVTEPNPSLPLLPPRGFIKCKGTLVGAKGKDSFPEDERQNGIAVAVCIAKPPVFASARVHCPKSAAPQASHHHLLVGSKMTNAHVGPIHMSRYTIGPRQLPRLGVEGKQDSDLGQRADNKTIYRRRKGNEPLQIAGGRRSWRHR